MQNTLLNIYLISHPIITILSDSTLDKNFYKKSKLEYKHKYLGLFLLYEILRKNISTKNIYIKQILYIKKINIIDNNNKYYILTNLNKTYNLINDINILIPQIKIFNIEPYINFYKNNKELFQILCNNKVKKNIIILDNIINNTEIFDLIKFLINDCKINKINIACLACDKQIINKLGNKYPKINIYTTKII